MEKLQALRVQLLAAERLYGLDRYRALANLIDAAEDERARLLIDQVEKANHRRVAARLGVSRQAIQQRTAVARRRLGGGS